MDRRTFLTIALAAPAFSQTAAAIHTDPETRRESQEARPLNGRSGVDPTGIFRRKPPA